MKELQELASRVCKRFGVPRPLMIRYGGDLLIGSAYLAQQEEIRLQDPNKHRLLLELAYHIDYKRTIGPYEEDGRRIYAILSKIVASEYEHAGEFPWEIVGDSLSVDQRRQYRRVRDGIIEFEQALQADILKTL